MDLSDVDLTDGNVESQLQIPQHNILDFGGKLMEINLVETVGLLTRCSFDERYRDPIISLGGVQALAELLLVSFVATASGSITSKLFGFRFSGGIFIS